MARAIEAFAESPLAVVGVMWMGSVGADDTCACASADDALLRISLRDPFLPILHVDAPLGGDVDLDLRCMHFFLALVFLSIVHEPLGLRPTFSLRLDLEWGRRPHVDVFCHIRARAPRYGSCTAAAHVDGADDAGDAALSFVHPRFSPASTLHTLHPLLQSLTRVGLFARILRSAKIRDQLNQVGDALTQAQDLFSVKTGLLTHAALGGAKRAAAERHAELLRALGRGRDVETAPGAGAA
ncbi:hypothetical protein B0H16DRAFT_1763554 [Mycena metata]|uniref:Uncharacterized protein n=1 Tax=Mycena metata TaxID=1033252 RepID=A0AAD7NSP3_9AGAR|nr:hypothetical protein B0H16DRAFT_1763554 [Mycena metata]